ncbi:hypothetical protein A4H97_10335 [Niastella yeongjuensis]|uniref:DUF5689 domain-containing protein n=1 Tax=Niastella yeongjuensis TaxID=354355 RepID=A0A1V9EF52_9BACT|nr:DUF5689 domain-containing protein [Niastella yeongjuensis]OQP44750.1 hypothetical protein A4H97_10335 [Niastella yeongjuensis]SEO76809.1 hypothetical protein SAMN05660816_03472 [Niastella yeongjuensis]
MKFSIKLLLIISIAVVTGSCKKDTYKDYPGGVPYDVISILDVRPLYKGKDVTLTKENMYGGIKLNAVVISDHTAGNLPKNLLVVQDMRRVQTLRGISIDLGDAAAKYHPGDSVVIVVAGKTLTRKNGILTITGVTEADITNAGKGTVGINAINSAQLQTNYYDYESSLCILNKSSFYPIPKPGETISGAKVVNDGFGNFILNTDPGVSYANDTPYTLAAYVGIPFGKPDSTVELKTRNAYDIIDMGSSEQDLLISGYQSDPKGGDGSYEYVQMLATKDIDFAVTPYSIVFCNNAGTASSATPLDAGWATGGQRTIKWNITSSSVKKGQFFYFGFQGKKINGSAGTASFSGPSWYQKNFLTSGNNAVTGAVNLPNLGDGGLAHPSEFGTSGPWANSGNTCGVAIFKGTTISAASVPEDVLFMATGGGAAVYDPKKTPILGYRICNNDWYSMNSVAIDSVTYKPVIVPCQQFQALGNTTSTAYPFNDAHPNNGKDASDAGLYSMMGGVYNITLRRWTTARKQVIVELIQTTATIDTLEKHPSVTKLVD